MSRKRLSKHEERRYVESYGKGTAISLAIGIAVLALVDQLVVPEVEINPIVYGIMAGVGIGAWPAVANKLWPRK